MKWAESATSGFRVGLSTLLSRSKTLSTATESGVVTAQPASDRSHRWSHAEGVGYVVVHSSCGELLEEYPSEEYHPLVLRLLLCHGKL